MRPLHHSIWMTSLSLLLALACSVNAATPIIGIDAAEARGELEVRFKGQKLLVYAFATNQFKPYVRELYTLRGENVLRDAPADHLHHHGMMYAVYVNGVNFWEEKGVPGIQKHVKLEHVGSSEAPGLPAAHFTEVIHWLAPTNPAAPLLIEERTIAVAVDEKRQEVAVRWDAQFQVGPKAGTVRLHGPNYNGLGLRLPESFNHVAKFQNSQGLPYIGPNTQNVIPAQWTSVAGVMEGREVMLVLFGNTEAGRFFFTMLDPFAYLAVTQGLDKQPVEHAAGDRFRLSYLLTVYTENKSAEYLRHRCEAWDKEGR